jgi:uncharacterized UBP type Zn finger protein
VYDLTDMERKKSKCAIEFPMILDMDSFMSKQDGTNESDMCNIYELKGIMLHEGSSAYSGHYVAQVFDPMSVPNHRICAI